MDETLRNIMRLQQLDSGLCEECRDMLRKMQILWKNQDIEREKLTHQETLRKQSEFEQRKEYLDE